MGSCSISVCYVGLTKNMFLIIQISFSPLCSSLSVSQIRIIHCVCPLPHHPHRHHHHLHRPLPSLPDRC